MISHERSRAFLERALATPATVHPDALTKSGLKLGLTVNQFLPLHGRIVPFSELNKALGR